MGNSVPDLEENTMVIRFHLDDEGKVRLSSAFDIGGDIPDDVALSYRMLLEGAIVSIQTEPERFLKISAQIEFAKYMREVEINDAPTPKGENGESVVSLEAFKTMKPMGEG